MTSPVIRSKSRAHAIELLDHYVTLVMEKSGLKPDGDTHAEIEELIDAIIMAAVIEVSHALKTRDE